MSHELFGSFHPNKLKQYQSQEFASSVDCMESLSLRMDISLVRIQMDSWSVKWSVIRMIQHFQRAFRTRGVPSSRIHYEYFDFRQDGHQWLSMTRLFSTLHYGSVRLGIGCWKSLRSSFIASQEIVQKTGNGCG